jgi:hypothetical protein
MEGWGRAWRGGRRQGDAEGVGRDDIKETSWPCEGFHGAFVKNWYLFASSGYYRSFTSHLK